MTKIHKTLQRGDRCFSHGFLLLSHTRLRVFAVLWLAFSVAGHGGTRCPSFVAIELYDDALLSPSLLLSS